jgi:AAA+ ATPase superfamily predicted ATPase
VYIMNKTGFRGRMAELAILDNLWESPQASLLILYGRRRVGKTRLLTHWLGRHPNRSIYWVAEPSSALHQLRSFSQTIYNFSHPGAMAPTDFTYANWEQAFGEVAHLCREEPLALFIDEVTYLIEVDSSFIGLLQRLWDHMLKESKLKLALAGSQRVLMEKEILSYQAPLYGRATAQIALPPLPFTVVSEFFPDYSLAEQVQIYAIFGGVPAYWERLDTNASILENIQYQLLTSNTLMQEEPRLLLQDFISDTHNYVGILQAIAQGAQTQLEISKYAGLSQGHISKYLSVLRETGFVERQVPVTEASKKSRRGQYYITDPYLRFYYRFLSAQQRHVALGSPTPALTQIEEHFPDFIEMYTWRDLSREWLATASVHNELPAPLEDIGGAWARKQEIDVVGINRAERRLALGVCRWRDEPVDRQALRNLIMATPTFVPKQGDWTVDYLGFSANGWTEDAKSLAQDINKSGEKGATWQAASCRLLDLEEVIADLQRWTPQLNDED